jgi:hypothetical protein
MERPDTNSTVTNSQWEQGAYSKALGLTPLQFAKLLIQENELGTAKDRSISQLSSFSAMLNNAINGLQGRQINKQIRLSLIEIKVSIDKQIQALAQNV